MPVGACSVRVVRIAVALAAIAAVLVLASTAPATHRQNPPPILLVSKAGMQRAMQESYCVFSPSHDGEGGGLRVCGDTPDLPPRRLSVVRAGEVVTITLRGTTSISEGSASVRVLGKRRSIRRFPLPRPSTRWRVRLRPGAYEVEIFTRFETADGRSGDTSGSLGILVDRKRRLAIVPLSAARPTPELTG